MSGYVILNKDNTTTPVHNLKTGLYLVEKTEAVAVIDQYSGRTIQK
jgi:hypothetical protein